MLGTEKWIQKVVVTSYHFIRILSNSRNCLLLTIDYVNELIIILSNSSASTKL